MLTVMKTQNELLKDFKSGNEQSLFLVMQYYYNDLFRYGIKFTADAEKTKDIINQFFLHIWDHRSKINAVENIKNYLVVSFKRFLIQQLCKKKINFRFMQQQEELTELPYESYIIATQQDNIIKKVLHDMIGALPPRQKQLLQMRFYEQMSYEAIAEKTSLSVRTVYNKLHEGVKKLRANSTIRKIYLHTSLFIVSSQLCSMF